MSLNSFLAQFTGIQLHIDWLALAESSPDVGLVQVTDRDQLGSLFTPWRIGADGTYADGKSLDAQPLRIDTPLFPEPVESSLRSYDAVQARLNGVPCYSLGNSELLILDGNHRLVALYRSSQVFSVDCWVISGPISRRIIPDLQFWEA